MDGGNKILIVEDDKRLSGLLARKFTAEKFQVIYVPTGERALELIDGGEKLDLILLGILLSGIDGFEVLRQVKASDASAGIPVIILSHLGEDSYIELGKKLGAVDFLVKASLMFDEVVARVRALLAKEQLLAIQSPEQN